MKNSFTFLLITLFMGTWLNAQVKIGDNPQNIDPSSILELESTDKVLVITRVTTAQMNAIVPSQGALCYNTELQAVHYYDGTQWVNIGAGVGTGGPLTNDPIVNDVSTIVITPTATGDNLEVAQNSIGSAQIIDGGVNGVDIQDGSIGPGKLQDNSVTEEKLSENSVGAFALDNANIGVSAFANDVGYLTAGDINSSVSADALNSITTGSDGGAFYDDTNLMNDVLDNTMAIAMDDDQSASNEIQNPTLTGTEIGLSGTAGTIDIGPLISAGGSDDQNLTLTGNVIEIEDGNTIDLTPILSSGDTDDQNLTLTGNIIEIDDGNTIDLTPILGSGGTDDQNLTLTGNIIEIEDGNTIDLTPILGSGGGTDDQTAAEVTYDPTTSGLLATDTQAAIDEIAAAGSTDDQTAAEVTYDPTTSGLLATDTQAAIDEIAAAGSTDDQTAAEVTYDPTTSGLLATDTQAAIDEIAAASTDDQTAAEVVYDPTTSGLTAIDTQAAIDELAAGSNEQSITLDIATNQIDLLNDDATINSSVLLDGLTLEAVNDGTNDVIQIKDEGVTTAKIEPAAALAPVEDQMLITTAAGDVEWAPLASHTGTPNSVFFADNITGEPTNAINPVNVPSFEWDQTARLGYGQLQIGLDGFTPPADVTKVVIAETLGSGTDVMFPLLVQTSAPASANASTGILFSPETHNPGTLAKGALIYQRTGGWAIGDFHFLQTSATGLALPTTADKAFTVRNNKDIVVYGGIETSNGLGTAGYVLSSQGAGNPVQWIPAGGSDDQDATEVDLAVPLDIDGDTIDETTVEEAIIVLAASSNGDNLSTINLVQTAGQDRIYNLSGQELIFSGAGGQIGIGDFGGAGAPASVRSKLDVDGQITSSNGFAAPSGTAGNPSYGFHTGLDTDMGMFRAGVDQLAFSTSGTEALRIDPNQNVGVGTTTPTSTLHARGSFAANIRSDPGATVLPAADDYTIIMTFATAVNLPAADATNLGRIYILKNATAATITIAGYISSGPNNDLLAGEVLQIQSDGGGNWYQIN